MERQSEAARLIVDFLNTNDIELGTDDIDTPARLRAWMAARLGVRRARVDQTALRTTLAAREALRDVLASHNGAPLARGAVAELNRSSRAAQVAVRWDPTGSASFDATETGPYRALGRIFVAAATCRAEETWDRLKVCPAEDCRAAFYDNSKNRSGKWCTMRVCGNRSKTRTYRERRRQSARSPVRR
jgi:predicted RNA-binding Zn ribbon-like protein